MCVGQASVPNLEDGIVGVAFVCGPGRRQPSAGGDTSGHHVGQCGSELLTAETAVQDGRDLVAPRQQDRSPGIDDDDRPGR